MIATSPSQARIFDRYEYTDHCIYTIRHSDAIKRLSRMKGPHSIDTKKKSWTSAKALIDEARKDGLVVPLLFAPAEDTTDVVALAELVRVGIGRTNECTFENLRFLPKPMRKTKLRKRDGSRLDNGFIREYAVCWTPPQLPPPLRDRNSRGTALSEYIPSDEDLSEGEAIQMFVNRYERHPVARQRCIEHYGTTCVACDVPLSHRYGPEVSGLIQVHHLTPLASIRKKVSVDPIRDLRPVCPNCHAVIHSTKPPRTIEQVRKMLRE